MNQKVTDPREQFEGQLRRALGHVRGRLLANRAQLHEKQRRLRKREQEVERRRNPELE
jgi:hypothetical protein